MDAAAAQGEPITRQEAVVAAEGLKLPEGEPKQPFEEKGYASEADYIDYRRRITEAERAPARGPGPDRANALRRANSMAIRLIEDEDMEFNAAMQKVYEETGVMPSDPAVRAGLRGGGDEGETPLTPLEARIKYGYDRGLTGEQLTAQVNANPDLTDAERHEGHRYISELFKRNAPLRPRAGGSFEGLRAIRDQVLGETGGAPPTRAPGAPPPGAGVPETAEEAAALSTETPEEFTSAIELLLQTEAARAIPSRADITRAAGAVPRTFRR